MTALKALISLFALISILIVIQSGYAMSIFTKKEEAVICSPLEGALTLNGKPASGAKITRWSALGDDEGENETFYADEHGKFSLPVRKVLYKKKVLAQFVAKQELTVTYKGADYSIFYVSKLGDEIYSELGGRPVGLTCELTAEDKPMNLLDSLVMTKCEWEEILKEE